MNLFESVILGIIQGIAEFLPISSSGHLAIFKRLFGLKDVGLTYDILLHVGTLVAVFIVYWKDIWELIVEGIGIIADFCRNISRFFGKLSGKKDVSYVKVINTPYRKFVMFVIVSTIPTGILGLVFKKCFNLDSPALIVPGIGLLITATLLFIVDELPRGRKDASKMSYRDSIIIGLSQGIATLPGISRSGTTMTIGVLCGLERKFAVKYSFIMSIPAIMGASIMDIKDMFALENRVSGTEFTYYIIGAVVAAVVGYFSIKTLLVLYRQQKIKYFSYYCFVAGIVAIVTYIAK